MWAEDRGQEQKDKLLFTPRPLTTSRTVKQAMLRDLGSRDHEFIEQVKDIRQKLVKLTHSTEDDYTAILLQGSGTFGLEAVVSSGMLPKNWSGFSESIIDFDLHPIPGPIFMRI